MQADQGQGASDRTWRDTAVLTGIRVVERLGRRLNHDVTPRSIYSPIPEVPPADHPVWQKEYATPAIDTESQLAFIEGKLASHLSELPEGWRLAEQNGFRLWNDFFMAGEAELTYALLRHLKPSRMIEVGSGYSTLVSAAALSNNAREGSPTEFVAVDPEPRTRLREGIEGVTRIETMDCRELPLERFEQLGPDDVFFIDTSHVVKLGSEVNWLVLEVLPRLRPGVWVHVHDIHLPYECPHWLIAGSGFFNEQYLLHAFLLGNRDWRVELSVSALYRRHRERLGRLIPSVLHDRPGGEPWSPSSFWIRRRLD